MAHRRSEQYEHTSVATNPYDSLLDDRHLHIGKKTATMAVRDEQDISALQKMLSATSGSILTSLLGTLKIFLLGRTLSTLFSWKQS
jgi:hypothetical protein